MGKLNLDKMRRQAVRDVPDRTEWTFERFDDQAYAEYYRDLTQWVEKIRQKYSRDDRVARIDLQQHDWIDEDQPDKFMVTIIAKVMFA